MRYVKVVFLFVLVTLISVGPLYAFSNVQHVSIGLTNKNVYVIEAEDKYFGESGDGDKQTVYSGSGFFITPTVILTSNHIVKGAKSIEIVYSNNIKLIGVVMGSDDANDLALIRVSGTESIVRPVALANSNCMRQGSKIYAVGFPLPLIMGMNPKISEGLISSTSGVQDDSRMYQISAPVQPGNSGGPLLNEQAEVVGVVAGCLNATKMMQQGIFPQNVNYAVKINNICNLIYYYGVDVSFNFLQRDDKKLNAADIMDIARKAVVFIAVTK